MRFGRRNKTGSMWGRLANADDPDNERSEEEPRFHHEGDPAQALLNVLGRFQRHYLRGREGTNQSEWSDDCMNALIDAVDVAVAQRWQEVVSVLTETARVLQTYEDADQANACVPFLTSSHEVLCHMVGDLLTGQIRPGLIRKWDVLYERAQSDIEAAGMALVQDEVSDQELAYEAFGGDSQQKSPFDEPSPDTPSELSPSEQVAESQTVDSEPAADEPEPPFPFELPELSDDVASDPFDAPVLDDLPDLAEPSELIPTIEAAAVSEFEAEHPAPDEDSEPRILSFPGHSVADAPPTEVDSDSLDEEVVTDPPTLELEADIDEPVAQAPAEVELEAQPEEPGVTSDDKISGVLDAACEALSNMTESLDAFETHVRELEARADESEWDGAAAACRSVLRLLEMLEARNIEPTDRFLELAYGFSGVYVESRDSVSTDEYRAFQKDCVSLLQEWMDERSEPAADSIAADEPAPVIAEPEPVASEESAPNDEDPALTDLLNTVRAAMQGGRPANAKLLMLEAAASIAQDQEGDAAKLVGEAERALSDNTRALEAARNAVQDHENGVSETAAKVSEAQHGHEDHRRQTALYVEQLEQSQSNVDALDEQIRELEKKREAAETDRAAAEEELEIARAIEEDHETQVEAVRNEERDARLRLEEERGRAKALQNSRRDLERAVIAQRELLARQRQSTHDIEQTIAHTRDSEAGESVAELDSLF